MTTNIDEMTTNIAEMTTITIISLRIVSVLLALLRRMTVDDSSVFFKSRMSRPHLKIC
jgi:hypothetical protein